MDKWSLMSNVSEDQINWSRHKKKCDGPMKMRSVGNGERCGDIHKWDLAFFFLLSSSKWFYFVVCLFITFCPWLGNAAAVRGVVLLTIHATTVFLLQFLVLHVVTLRSFVGSRFLFVENFLQFAFHLREETCFCFVLNVHAQESAGSLRGRGGWEGCRIKKIQCNPALVHPLFT